MKLQGIRSPSSEFKIRILTLPEMDETLISAWEELEVRAIEPNPFLSPNFVIPALKYVREAPDLLAIFIERIAAGTSILTGGALFTLSKPSKHFPLPHLKTYSTIYSYISGFLIDPLYAHETLQTLFHFLTRTGEKWNGLMIEDQAMGGPLPPIEREKAAEFGMKWFSREEWDRAAIRPAGLTEGLNGIKSKNVKKTIHRRMRRLEELGTVEWNVRSNGTLSIETINGFLKLEHKGWKGEQGTSLLSKDTDVAFFKEVVMNFNRAGRSFFTELSLNGNAIASEAGFLSGKNAFCFKIGWDTDYFKCSPGYLNLSKWLDAKTNFPFDLDLIDSGSDEDAMYMNELWPHRRSFRTGIYAINALGKSALALLDMKAKIKKIIKKQG